MHGAWCYRGVADWYNARVTHSCNACSDCDRRRGFWQEVPWHTRLESGISLYRPWHASALPMPWQLLFSSPTCKILCSTFGRDLWQNAAATPCEAQTHLQGTDLLLLPPQLPCRPFPRLPGQVGLVYHLIVLPGEGGVARLHFCQLSLGSRQGLQGMGQACR